MSAGIEKNPGLDINYKMADRALQALIYGDVFMRVPTKHVLMRQFRDLPMHCMKNG
jgi:predicted nucleotide-binding protein (sugar kinase/HSP70/actin superfamily)